MKVSHSIRTLYGEQLQINERLKMKVDAMLRALAAGKRWHYESRIKSETSFALKLESGRIKNPHAAEDYFACTLVVQNLSEIEDAKQEITSRFRITETRPREAGKTHKAADTFPFDDLRLYGYWKDDQSLPETGLSAVKFEVQIKTFLQHAWGIATHDLIYKTDDVSWSKQRIAYQIKAMLEHAEISIQEADRLSESAALAKSQRDIEQMKNIILLLKEIWPAESLPSDLRRLAGNTQNVMTLAGMDIAKLRAAVAAERVRQKGSLPINISPYAIIVQAIAWHNGDALRAGLASRDSREKIFVTEEMELPEWVRLPDMVNVIHADAGP
jgi:ppGpp synthetase/RelA/SpoT-type nucleotidyltranferase